MTTRVLISDDGRLRTFRVNNDQGVQVGTDVETTPTTSEQNTVTLQDRMVQALTVNVNFLGVASPTNAQLAAQVQRLTRECSALIRLQLSQFDDISGT